MKGYCQLKDEAQDRTLWRTLFERVHVRVVRQTTECMRNLQCGRGSHNTSWRAVCGPWVTGWRSMSSR